MGKLQEGDITNINYHKIHLLKRILCWYPAATCARIWNPDLISSSRFEELSASVSFSVFISAPLIPLARCAQIESAEMRSRRSDNMRMICRSDCGIDMKRASPARVETTGFEYWSKAVYLVFLCPFGPFYTKNGLIGVQSVYIWLVSLLCRTYLSAYHIIGCISSSSIHRIYDMTVLI